LTAEYQTGARCVSRVPSATRTWTQCRAPGIPTRHVMSVAVAITIRIGLTEARSVGNGSRVSTPVGAPEDALIEMEALVGRGK
jgi:hypothetical protein